MSISTLPPSAQQPGPAIYCRSETVKAGEVQAVGHVARWVKRPEPRDQGWHNAVLVIDGSSYRAECFFTCDGDTGHVWQVIDLRTWDGGHYRLTIGPDGVNCDCPHMTFRGVACKHASAVAEALDHLDRLEQAERLLANAAAYRNELAEAPF